MAARGLMRRNNLKITLNEVTNLYIEHIINSVLLVDVDTDKIKFVVDSLEMEYNFGIVYDKLKRFWDKVCDNSPEHVAIIRGKKFKITADFCNIVKKSDEQLYEKIRESLDIPVYKPKKEVFLLKELSDYIPAHIIRVTVEDEKGNKAYKEIEIAVATSGLICGEKYSIDDEEVDALGFEVDLSNVVGDLHEMIEKGIECNQQLPERIYSERDYGRVSIGVSKPFAGLEATSEEILNSAVKQVVNRMFRYMLDNCMLIG